MEKSGKKGRKKREKSHAIPMKASWTESGDGEAKRLRVCAVSRKAGQGNVFKSVPAFKYINIYD